MGTTFWFDLPLEQADSDELMVEGERRSQQARLAEPNLAGV